jgi:hypothetical protein
MLTFGLVRSPITHEKEYIERHFSVLLQTAAGILYIMSINIIQRSGKSSETSMGTNGTNWDSAPVRIRIDHGDIHNVSVYVGPTDCSKVPS